MWSAQVCDSPYQCNKERLHSTCVTYLRALVCLMLAEHGKPSGPVMEWHGKCESINEMGINGRGQPRKRQERAESKQAAIKGLRLIFSIRRIQYYNTTLLTSIVTGDMLFTTILMCAWYLHSNFLSQPICVGGKTDVSFCHAQISQEKGNELSGVQGGHLSGMGRAI